MYLLRMLHSKVFLIFIRVDRVACQFILSVDVTRKWIHGEAVLMKCNKLVELLRKSVQ